MSKAVAAVETSARRRERLSVAVPVLLTAVLGLTLIYITGFAGSHVIHNAAHDARHSLNFPCH